MISMQPILFLCPSSLPLDSSDIDSRRSGKCIDAAAFVFIVHGAEDLTPGLRMSAGVPLGLEYAPEMLEKALPRDRYVAGLMPSGFAF